MAKQVRIMTAELRGVMQIKTMGGLIDARRTRTSAGALLELSMLEMEKERLKKEMLRAERRIGEIRARSHDIETKQQRLNQFVERSAEISPAVEAALTRSTASALPIHQAPADGFKRRQLSY
jgi:hypothetical protein